MTKLTRNSQTWMKSVGKGALTVLFNDEKMMKCEGVMIKHRKRYTPKVSTILQMLLKVCVDATNKPWICCRLNTCLGSLLV